MEKPGPFASLAAMLGLLIHPLTQLRHRGADADLHPDLPRGPAEQADQAGRHQRPSPHHDGHRRGRPQAEQAVRHAALINTTTGAFIGAALFLIGVPGALLWGILTAVLRFVPYVGTLLASVFPIIIAAAVGDGWTLALLTLGIILVTETLVGHVLEPLFFGKSTGLSPVAVVAAAAFWTAIWGPVGLVLSTPITMMLLVIGRNIEALQFLEVLLGSKPVLTPDHAFYQRMLANDPLEAAEHAQSFEERGELDKYLVEVVIPGLLLAQIDKDRKVLNQEREVSVVNAYAELLEEVWPESPLAADAPPPVLLVSAHGALNFAGALSVSALLRLKKVPHRLLPPDAVQPGHFPEELAAGAGIVCLCYLKAPSAEKYAYLERRIAVRLPRSERSSGLPGRTARAHAR
jgi:hypothetical protein